MVFDELATLEINPNPLLSPVSRTFETVDPLASKIGHSNGNLSGITGVNKAGVNDVDMSISLSLMLAAVNPEITQVYSVSAEILAIQIETGQVTHGQQQPYQASPDDVLRRQSDSTWIERQGQIIGALVEDTVLYSLDRFTGQPLDLAWASTPESFRISSNTDADYQIGYTPETVSRKSKPTDMARVGIWEFEWPLNHTLYLHLPTPMEVGQTYTLEFPNSDYSSLTFQYQPEQQPSEAVHISQVGFRPDDPLKLGYLSTWMGDGGGVDYPEGLTFWLIDQATGQRAFTGTATHHRPLQQTEDPRGQDYTLTEVQVLDFSTFNQSGQYRLCVETVGCSFAFEIQEDVWQSAFYVSARGLYHQRSGIAIGPPYTAYERPRAFHPDDGVVVYQSNATLLETDMGLGTKDAFSALVEGKTDEILTNAWGGYFDAGDWDRRIQHLEVSRILLELVELYPDYFSILNLNIPESNNALPDLIDEALWSLDFFRRLQTPEGGIRGGIESANHPRFGEASWQESLTVMAYAPDMWSSYVYAGVAARAADQLVTLDSDLSIRYRNSALQAMGFAEEAYARALDQGTTLHHEVVDARNLAALELFRLTGDEGWHAIFLNTTVFEDETARAYVYGQHNQRDAAFLYARLSDLRLNVQVQQNALRALRRDADSLAALARDTGFGWSKPDPWAPIGAGNSLGAPKSIAMIRAHALTDEPSYLMDAIRTTQYSLGANPENRVYTTGLGHRSPENPLILDQRILGTTPPPGITVYGPLDLINTPDYWTVQLLQNVTYPAPQVWPTTEAYFDVFLFPAVTEFTVMQTIAQASYTWGYLAARDSSQEKDWVKSAISTFSSSLP
jgi:endoglucanase